MRSLALPRPRTQPRHRHDPPARARHAGASEQRRQRNRGSYRAGWTRRSIEWPEARPAASPSTTRSSPSRRRPPSRARAQPQPPQAPRRHAGPYGASFDGTDPNGKPAKGLTFERRWTRPGVHPYDEITWEYRTAGIANETGKSVFEQKDVEVPDFWCQLATNVVVSKYFRGHLGTPERETSVRQLIDRVVNTIAAWAETQRYFATRRGPRRPSRPS